MIRDYGAYELSGKERAGFLLCGYACFFLISFLFFRSAVVSALAGLTIRFFLPRFADALARRRREQLELQFRDLLYSLSASVAAGRQMEEALVEADENLSSMYPEEAPIVQELHHMKRSILENNAADRLLLSDFARRSRSEDINSFVQVYLTCRSMGGDLERIIIHTSEIMTDKMEIKAQIAVLTAQKKLEGRIISAMPLAMLLALNLVSPAYIDVLYTTLTGRLVMLLCLGGTAAGVWMMEKLTDEEV